MIETKAGHEMAMPEVAAKRQAAEEWCVNASAHAATYGGEPWRCPARRRLSKDVEQKLPVLLRGLDDLPPELLEMGEKARAAAAGLADRLIVRRVRDELDKAKRRQGPIAKNGIRGVETRIRQQLAANHQDREQSILSSRA